VYLTTITEVKQIDRTSIQSFFMSETVARQINNKTVNIGSHKQLKMLLKNSRWRNDKFVQHLIRTWVTHTKCDQNHGNSLYELGHTDVSWPLYGPTCLSVFIEPLLKGKAQYSNTFFLLILISSVLYWKYYLPCYKTSYLNEEVNCTEQSPSVSIPRSKEPLLKGKSWYCSNPCTN
jgi:hypothetical protein